MTKGLNLGVFGSILGILPPVVPVVFSSPSANLINSASLYLKIGLKSLPNSMSWHSISS